MLEGHQMTSRGRPMLFCDPACYDAATQADVAAAELAVGPTE